jgi:hypothetical protein
MPGIYSKRNFKMRYKNALGLKPAETSYVVAIFSIADFGVLCKTVGYTTAHSLVKELGIIISRHFAAVGGFSTRQRRSRFMTVLPFSNYRESREMIDAFATDLMENGFEYVKLKNKNSELLDTPVYKIKVMTGIAEGIADGYFEGCIYLWDIAAAGLIVKQAGGVGEIVALREEPHQMSYICSNGHVQEELKALIGTGLL